MNVPGSIGPCSPGHQFIVPHSSTPTDGNHVRYAECVCKEGHIRWFGDGACYRPYTRGPCSAGNLYSVNITVRYCRDSIFVLIIMYII